MTSFIAFMKVYKPDEGKIGLKDMTIIWRDM